MRGWSVELARAPVITVAVEVLPSTLLVFNSALPPDTFSYLTIPILIVFGLDVVLVESGKRFLGINLVIHLNIFNIFQFNYFSF